MSERIETPWNWKQVDALNAFQSMSGQHQFTCGAEVYCGKNWPEPCATLIATPDGWRCPNCVYTQDWAWDWMFDLGRRIMEERSNAAESLGVWLASRFPCGNMLCGTIGRCRCGDPLPRPQDQLIVRSGA